MDKIRALMVIGGLGQEGISHYAMNYLMYTKSEEIQIDLCIAGACNKELYEQLIDNGIRCFILPSRNKDPLKYFIKEVKLIRKNKYQIVHVNGNSATMSIDLLGAFLGGSKIRIAHSHNSTCTHKTADRFLRPIFNRLYTDGFACSKVAGKWLFKDGNFQVIENAIPFEKYEFNSEKRRYTRDQLGIKTEDFVFGHIGCFNEQKNHKFLVDVFCEYISLNSNQRCFLLLIGEGPLQQQIIEYVKEKGIQDKVIFYGTTTEVTNVLSAMDVFLLPSLFEGLPIVLLEAQINGLKCFISDRVTKDADITDECVFLPLEKQDWIKSIKCFENLGSELSHKECLTYKSKRFNISSQAKELVNKYKKILYRKNI